MYNTVTLRKKRSLLAQFRSGTLPLAIETGRFKNQIPEERICEICKNGDIESEYHFLIICNAYARIRNNMYSQVTEIFPQFLHLDNNSKFLYLIKTNGKKYEIT
jgi:hypothetical protein